MITKNDWDDALDACIADERQRVSRAMRVYFPGRRMPNVLSYAAVIALTFFVINTHSDREPYVHAARYDLRDVHSRGVGSPQPIELPGDEELYLITVALSEPAHDPAYRIELADESHTIWKSRSTQPSDGVFDLSIPRSFLRGSTYRVRVFGVDAAGTHLRDEYRIHVAGAPQKAEGRIFSSE